MNTKPTKTNMANVAAFCENKLASIMTQLFGRFDTHDALDEFVDDTREEVDVVDDLRQRGSRWGVLPTLPTTRGQSILRGLWGVACYGVMWMV